MSTRDVGSGQCRITFPHLPTFPLFLLEFSFPLACNLQAFINPIGGHRKALKTWAAVKPVFDRAGVAVTEGGDGLFNEVLNGLAKRRHHAPPCIHPSRLSSARLSLPPSSHLSSTPPPLASSGSPAALSSAASVLCQVIPTHVSFSLSHLSVSLSRCTGFWAIACLWMWRESTTWKEEEQAGKQGEQSEEEKEEEGQRKEGEQAETGGEIGGSGGREEGGEGEAELVREGFAGGDGREKAGGAGSETEGAKARQKKRRRMRVWSYGFYGDVIRRSEGLRWMGPARYDYAGLMTYLHHRSYDAEVSYFDVHPSAGPAPRPAIQASPVQRAGLEASPSTAAESDASAVQAAATLGESPSQGVLAPLCWQQHHHWKRGLDVLSNDKAPDGFAAQAHLADGNLHLILIRKCSRPEYLHQLTRLARKGADPFAFEFVETYKTPAFMFTSHGKQSTWNVDGELVVASQLSAQVFRGLVDIFASGPEF
ncbi:unnamed protein product [Closterium sp. NIES-65]|nr:unnamed protein product [Closterium sp. NIES-65]